jgi:hypothetical protein
MPTFKYLRRMHMDSMSDDLLRKLKEEEGAARAEVERLKATTVEEVWLAELGKLRDELDAAERDKHDNYYMEAKSTLSNAPSAGGARGRRGADRRNKGGGRDAAAGTKVGGGRR